MPIEYILGSVAYLALCLLAGYSATLKHRPFGLGFSVSFVMTPFLGLLVVALLPAHPRSQH